MPAQPFSTRPSEGKKKKDMEQPQPQPPVIVKNFESPIVVTQAELERVTCRLYDRPENIRIRYNELRSMMMRDLLCTFVAGELGGKFELLCRIDHDYLHEAVSANLPPGIGCFSCDDIERAANAVAGACETAYGLAPPGNDPSFVKRLGFGFMVKRYRRERKAKQQQQPKQQEVVKCAMCRKVVPEIEIRPWCDTCQCTRPVHVSCLTEHLFDTGLCPTCDAPLTVLGYVPLPTETTKAARAAKADTSKAKTSVHQVIHLIEQLIAKPQRSTAAK